MGRHYSSKDFFRQVPNALLARYFHGRGLMPELDFAAMPEGKPEPLFEAWAALPDAQRNAAEADFREIWGMSDRKGFQAIVDEARWQLEDQPDAAYSFIDLLSTLDDFQARAMVAFLDHPECWKGATRFHYADSLTWRKRKNLPRVPAAADKASVARLAELIKHYFRLTDGRGRNCVVEAYRRGDRDYFFAFPEDHAQRSIEWVDGEFNPRPHNPAFEIVFVYHQAEGTLDLNFRGGRSAITALQGMFAQAILKLDELPPDPKDERVYDLAPLSQPGFQFTHTVGSGVGTVVVKKLRLSSRVRSFGRQDHRGGRRAQQPRGGARIAGAGGPVGAAAPVQRDASGTGGHRLRGRRQAAENGEHSHHAPELVFAEVRRDRPESAADAGGLGH